MKSKLYQILILTLAIFAIACSKDDNTTSPTDNVGLTVTSSGQNIFVSDSNCYFVSEKYTLDTLNKRIVSTKEIDSLVNIGKLTIPLYGDNGVEYNQVVNWFTNYKEATPVEAIGYQSYFTKNSDVYTTSNWFDDLISMSGSVVKLPFEIDAKQALKIVSLSASNWNVYTKVFKDEALSFGVINGTLTVDAKKTGTTDIVLAGINFKNTLKYDYVLSFVGKIKATTGEYDVNLSRTLSVWYADGYGKIKEYMPNSKMVIVGLTSGYDLPGFEKFLIKSNRKFNSVEGKK